MRTLLIGFMFLASLGFATSAGAVVINEFVANDVGADDWEFIELCGTPGESLDGLTIVLIEGESPSEGLVDRIISLNGYVIGASGYFVIGDPLTTPDLPQATGFIENGGNNILLLSGFDPAAYPVGFDIDANADCTAEVAIGTVVDGVGYGYGAAAVDCATYYGIPAVGPDATFDPAGASRCDDCDAFGGDWYMVCLTGTEPAPTGVECVEPNFYIGFSSPGDPNDCSTVAVEPSTWGHMKALFHN